jgi:hypothetical protein
MNTVSVYQAIQAVMADLGKEGLSKTRTNSQQGFKYRGVDDAMNALSPLLAKHNLVILPRVIKRETVERLSASNKPLFYTTLEVEYDFIGTADGSKHTVGPMVGEAMDSGDKSAGKAMSYAYKAVCIQAFCIPTEGDNDPDANTHDVKPVEWDGREQITFGKENQYKGSMWRDAPQDYIVWIYGNTKLPVEHRRMAEKELTRRRDETRSAQTPS